jgi:protein-tyrosine phosphatase
VLFVCHGQHLPLAHGRDVFFAEHVKRAGFERRIRVESAGIGDWHVGQRPDERAIAQDGGGDTTSSRCARGKSGTRDFARFDWILAMDRRNLRDLGLLRPGISRAISASFSTLPLNSACARCPILFRRRRRLRKGA